MVDPKPHRPFGLGGLAGLHGKSVGNLAKKVSQTYVSKDIASEGWNSSATNRMRHVDSIRKHVPIIEECEKLNISDDRLDLSKSLEIMQLSGGSCGMRFSSQEMRFLNCNATKLKESSAILEQYFNQMTPEVKKQKINESTLRLFLETETNHSTQNPTSGSHTSPEWSIATFHQLADEVTTLLKGIQDFIKSKQNELSVLEASGVQKLSKQSSDEDTQTSSTGGRTSRHVPEWLEVVQRAYEREVERVLEMREKHRVKEVLKEKEREKEREREREELSRADYSLSSDPSLSDPSINTTLSSSVSSSSSPTTSSSTPTPTPSTSKPPDPHKLRVLTKGKLACYLALCMQGEGEREGQGVRCGPIEERAILEVLQATNDATLSVLDEDLDAWREGGLTTWKEHTYTPLPSSSSISSSSSSRHHRTHHRHTPSHSSSIPSPSSPQPIHLLDTLHSPSSSPFTSPIRSLPNISSTSHSSSPSHDTNLPPPPPPPPPSPPSSSPHSSPLDRPLVLPPDLLPLRSPHPPSLSPPSNDDSPSPRLGFLTSILSSSSSSITPPPLPPSSLSSSPSSSSMLVLPPITHSPRKQSTITTTPSTPPPSSSSSSSILHTPTPSPTPSPSPSHPHPHSHSSYHHSSHHKKLTSSYWAERFYSFLCKVTEIKSLPSDQKSLHEFGNFLI